MRRILILGAGVSGLAAAALADSKGISATIYDAAPSPEALGSGRAIASGPWDHLLLTGVDLVVASPGFAERSLPVVETLEFGVPIWSEIEFASRYIDIPLAAITGTNGKTTVTEATARMLSESGLDAPAVGNIGAPLSDYTETSHDALVVETSSFQLRFIEDFHPVAAAITNVAVDHLDWHGSAGAYAEAKRNIYKNQTGDDLLVYDQDDEGATRLAADAPGRKFPVSGRSLPESGGGVSGNRLLVGDVSVDVDTLDSRDPVHLVNLASAAALASWLGAKADAVEQASRDFRPGRHRRQIVAEANGVRWIDDSKATNPHAAIASIRGHKSVILIAGGLAKGTDVSEITREPNLTAVLGIGEAGPEIVESAGHLGVLVETLDRAVERAAEIARPGDTVLLAPGCASFDQFKSYGERGDVFQKMVKETLKEVSTR